MSHFEVVIMRKAYYKLEHSDFFSFTRLDIPKLDFMIFYSFLNVSIYHSFYVHCGQVCI